MSQDQPKTNDGKDSDSKEALAQISQVAVLNSMLTESDVTAIAKAIDTSKNVPSEQVFARQAVQLGKLTPFQAKLLLARDNAILSLGPYVLLDKIGQGGMGSVYKAKHKSMERIVALKVLRRKSGLSQDSIKRFQREVLASAKLIHPNIVTAFDAGEQNRIHYLVMEYVEGGDLKSLLDREGPLPLSKALHYVIQTARGMQYAHEKQIIHRDIKPANLLVDNTGCIKILDLGLARIVQEGALEDEQQLTADGALMGTVDFLSPEQSLDTKTADVRSDIYSLGCTLYTLLTGESVFPGGTLVQKILAHRELPPPSVREKRKDVPEALDKLLKTMLAKKPADRPQSMAIIAEQLQNILAGDCTTEATTKLAPNKTAEDSFLETLVFNGSETQAESNETSTPQWTLPQATSANVPADNSWNTVSTFRPQTQSTIRNKPKETKTTLLKSYWPFGVAAGLVLLLSLGFGLTLLFPTKPKQLTLAFDPNQLREITGASIKVNSVSKGTVAPDNPNVVIDLEGNENELRIEKQGYQPFQKSFNIADPSSLSISIKLAKFRQLNLSFDPAELSEISGASIKVNSVAKGTVSADNDKFVIDLEGSENELRIEKPGYQPFNKTFDITNESSLKIDVRLAKDLPALAPAPVPVPQEPVPTPPETMPPPATSPTSPKTLIVGLGKDELPDLKTAIEQARPNDTILIKHRGPLDLSPTDLTGKTPLTIEGGQQSDVDFWPIIRQTILSTEEFAKKTQEGPSKQALFHGDKLELKFKKLHLSTGGFAREPLECLLRCNSGEISFEDCTITASTDDANRFAEGMSLPFVRTEGAQSSHLSIKLVRSAIRGARLKSLVKISDSGNVAVEGEQLLWAGGAGSLVELGQSGSFAKLKLSESTIYNITSVLDIPRENLVGNDLNNLFELYLTSSLLVARQKGNSQFVVITGSENQTIDNNRWQKLLKLISSNSIVANFDSWLPSTDKLKTLADFKTLLQLDREALTETDPRFRVNPDGVELQEVNALDFVATNIRGSKSSSNPNSEEAIVGIAPSKLPPILPGIAERPIPSTELLNRPRDIPIIIEVSKTTGPIRSLEEAFAQAQGDDVTILITDSATYTPSRNFDVDSKNGVLYKEAVSHLTIKAKDGQNPKIIISDSPEVQIGKVPDSAHWEDAPQLFLISTRCQSMTLEGLTFETDIKRNFRHSVLLTTAMKLRMTNCKILDYSTTSQAYFDDCNGFGVVIPKATVLPSEQSVAGGVIYWFENLIIEHPLPPADKVPDHFVQLPTAFSFMAGGTSSHIVFRNTAIGSNLTTIFTRANNAWVEIENCTLLGRLLALNNSLRSVHVENSIIYCAPNPVITFPPGLVDSVNVSGGSNAVWMPSSTITAQTRNQGPLRWMPGPVLTRMPTIEKTYQLKSRQKELATMATDGGPVGFRPERVPKQ
jgi:serine/threonine protein kinase